MITMPIDPILFTIGHFTVRWYSLIILLAILVGIWVARREAKRRGLGREVIDDLAIWLVPAGIVGARLFHVADHWDHVYSLDPIRVLYIWQGGLAIWGGVFGGLTALVVLAWRRGWRVPVLLDTLAPAEALGQGLGRIACVITGDAMGKPTAGPFGIAYTSPHALVPELGVYYTPTPIYELIMNVGIFALLWQLRKRNLPDGALFLIYLLLYSSGRFLITFWSAYRPIAFGLNQAQLISLAAVAMGLPLLVYVWRRPGAARAESNV
ncbi:MAG: prolipoprotein diacylglyceryl transferase [Litorilinea sp.]|nr:MAG: prolipoprotein diacylglyceryl transferase [Litorilinea sp.]GIV80414.1 MAG: prolipoprotein diacylglyceryl transferase [Litorilinea sp.]